MPHKLVRVSVEDEADTMYVEVDGREVYCGYAEHDLSSLIAVVKALDADFEYVELK